MCPGPTFDREGSRPSSRMPAFATWDGSKPVPVFPTPVAHRGHCTGISVAAKAQRASHNARGLDRLFRSALDALKVVESLKVRRVHLHLLDLGGDIAGNGISKLFLTIAAAFAEAERDRIRERIGQMKADQKARGLYLGGDVPFGFERGDDGELVPVEAQHRRLSEKWPPCGLRGGP